MTYRFLLDSTVEDNLHRLLQEQLEGAIAQIGGGVPADPEAAIHDVRKRLKKVRSLLRLVRPALDSSAYAAANDQLRALGQSLAPARDGAVYQATLANLLNLYGSTLDPHAFVDLQASLADWYRGQLERLEIGDRTLDAFGADLKDIKAQLTQLPLKKTGWAAIAPGLKRIYRQGRERFQVAYDGGDDEAFHDWRKRVKDLTHDLHLLKALWPPVLKAFETETDRLAELLGDDHDLAALHQFLSSHAAALAIDEVALAVLLPLIDHRQRVLRQQANALGQTLYSETPRAFVSRLSRYWQTQITQATAAN